MMLDLLKVKHALEVQDKAIEVLCAMVTRLAGSPTSEAKAILEEVKSISNKALAELEKPADDIEKAYQVLEVYGVSRERAKTIANGIGVLATRFRKEINATNAEFAALTFIPSGREHEIACSYAVCDWGQGLGGSGRCSGHGNPRDPHCPKFTTEAGDYNPSNLPDAENQPIPEEGVTGCGLPCSVDEAVERFRVFANVDARNLAKAEKQSIPEATK